MKCIVDDCERDRAPGALMCSLHMDSVPRDDARGETPLKRLKSLEKSWRKIVRDARDERGG